ncbi:MAG: hypothetical protein WBA87_07945 [Microbacterium sp.]
MTLFQFNRAAELVESIADDLRDIARQSFDAVTARREAERRFDHMIDRTRPYTSEIQRILDTEVTRSQKESETALQNQAFALVQQLPDAEAELSRTFEEIRPRRDTSTQVAVSLSQERWAAAKEILDSGRPLASAIAVADLDGLLAIEAFAPEHLFAESTRGTLEAPGGDFKQIKRSVELNVRARLPELVDASTAEVLKKAHRANGFVEIAWEWAEHLNRRFSGFATDAMGASVAITYIRREYGIDQTPQQVRDARNADVSTEASRSLRRVEAWAKRVQQA